MSVSSLHHVSNSVIMSTSDIFAKKSMFVPLKPNVEEYSPWMFQELIMRDLILIKLIFIDY